MKKAGFLAFLKQLARGDGIALAAGLALAAAGPTAAAAPGDRLEIVTGAAHLRDGPDKDAQVIGRLKRGDRLVEQSRIGSYVAVKVLKNGYQGWVYGPAQGWAPSGQVAEAAPQGAPASVAQPSGLSLPVETLQLEMKPLDAKVLFRKEPHDTSAFPVSVLDQAGKLAATVEVKGSFTRRFLKKSLLIKLKDGRAWQGYRRISLNSMVTDASMMREWLAWDLARAAGMVAPKTVYTRLVINGKYAGLYLFTEWIDADMFARAGLGADGDLFHPDDSTYCGDLSPASLDRSRNCWLKLSPGDKDFSPLAGLVKEIDATPAAGFLEFMDRTFQSDSVINWIAVNALVSNSDTYNKNYFLYRSKAAGKWTMVPWDYDLTFGRNWDPYLPFPQSVFNDNFQYYYPPDLGMPSPLKVKTLENPALMVRLKARLRHLLGIGAPGEGPGYGWFSPDKVAGRIDAIKAEIRKDAEQDPYAPNRVKLFEEQAEALKYYALAHHAYLRTSVLGATEWIYTPVPVPPLYGPFEMGASQRVAPGDAGAELVDPARGLVVAALRIHSLNVPATLAGEVEAERRPEFLPAGRSADECIQRNWMLTVKTPFANLVADVTLEYLQEHSRHHELGAKVANQGNLALWVLDDGAWRQLPTTVNSLSKTLTVRQLPIPSGRVLRFVACNAG